MKKILLLLTIASCFASASTQFYSISTCTTDDYAGALLCKNKIARNAKIDIYIIQSDDLKYRTTYGKFDTYDEAQKFEKILPQVIKAQKPFIKNFNLSNNSIKFIEKYSLSNFKEAIQINLVTAKLLEDNKSVLDIQLNNSQLQTKESNISKDLNNSKNENLYKEETSDGFLSSIVIFMKKIFGTKEDEEIELVVVDKFKEFNITTKQLVLKIDSNKSSSDIKKNLETITIIPSPIKEENISIVSKIVTKTKESKRNDISTKSIAKKEISAIKIDKSNVNTIITPSIELAKYDEIIITVDSTINRLYLQGRKNNTLTNISEYVVSTAKKSLPKPQGEGKITAISLAPTWYPTPKTIAYFKTKGIELPAVVPPGDTNNYMGLAKINLNHIVNGKNIYRIHGTLNERTLGTHESGGCIRMKNKEVLALAKLLKSFVDIKKSMQYIKVILK